MGCSPSSWSKRNSKMASAPIWLSPNVSAPCGFQSLAEGSLAHAGWKRIGKIWGQGSVARDSHSHVGYWLGYPISKSLFFFFS